MTLGEFNTLAKSHCNNRSCPGQRGVDSCVGCDWLLNHWQNEKIEIQSIEPPDPCDNCIIKKENCHFLFNGSFCRFIGAAMALEIECKEQQV